MIAPAALAVGMLMGELAGYQEAARGSIAEQGEQAVAQAQQRSATETSEIEMPGGVSDVGQAPGEGPTFTSGTDLGDGLPDDITVFAPTAAPPIAQRRGHPGVDARAGSMAAGDGSAGTPRAHPADASAVTASQSPAPSPGTPLSTPPKTGPDGTAAAASTAQQNTDDQSAERDQATGETARDSAGGSGTDGSDAAGATTGAQAAGAAGAVAAEGTAGLAANGAASGTATNGAPANQVPAGGSPANGADVSAVMALDGQAGEGQRTLSVPAGRDGVLDPSRLPEPFGPALVYGGLIRIPQQVPVRQAPVVKQRRPKAAPEERTEPDTEETPLTCVAEWRDTWLWELCREHIAATLSTSTRTDPAVRPRPGRGASKHHSPGRGASKHYKGPERDVIGR